jgi:predicted site-specific integrase-resolvase
MSEIATAWMTPEQAMEYLGGISAATLARYRKNGLPVHYITEKTPRYDRAEVDAWIRERGREVRESM